MTDTILEVRNLKKYYPIQTGFLRRVTGQIRAVDNVNFTVRRGETLALVGESGCGKTTVAKSILRAFDVTEGQITFHGDGAETDVARLQGSQLRRFRRHIQMIFQDPYSSLNPRQRVRDIVAEPLLLNGMARGSELTRRVQELLDMVGLRPEYGVRYPHAFSGGQRQRIGVARALALNPELIVCDEPVSALDVSIQAQILNLLKDLQEEFSLTYLFISHDLGVVQYVSDRVAVMYVGKLVELASAEDLFARPRHPYTEALLSASPKPHPRYRGQLTTVTGEVADAANPPSGCHFRSRCLHAQQLCADAEPPLRPVGTTGQLAACHFAEELELNGVA